MTAPYSGGSEHDGDSVLFRCSSAVFGCGAVASAVAAVGCTDQVLALFVPELSWLVLVPAAFITLVGALGLCASRRQVSKIFRAQLAVFLLMLSGMLGGAGVFTFTASAASANWLVDGCDDYRALGLWTSAGRLKKKVKLAFDQYQMLKGGWERCRSLNPLVVDLSDCGVRAKCSDQKYAYQQPLYSWFQKVQPSLPCGGFCRDEVPLFGSTTMRDTLTAKAACASKSADALETNGRLLGIFSAAISIPVIAAAVVLSCAASCANDEFMEVEHSDPDEPLSDDGRFSLLAGQE